MSLPLKQKLSGTTEVITDLFNTAVNVGELLSNNKTSVPLIPMEIIPVESNGKIDRDNIITQLLLNPETLEENKSSNWAVHNIPGQSDPVLQWISGGPRTISFDALVTKDKSRNSDPEGSPNNPTQLANRILNSAEKRVKNSTVGKIASAFSNVVSALTSKTNTKESVQLSISEELSFYRSLLYPEYDKNTLKLTNSPPLVVIRAGSTFNIFQEEAELSLFTEVWVITSLKINITKQFPNLDPMEATVSFQLTQYSSAPMSRSDF